MTKTTEKQAITRQAKAAISDFFALLQKPPVNQEEEHSQFMTMFLPSFSVICEHESPAIVLQIEQMLYVNYVKRWETESHFRAIYQEISPHLRKTAFSASSDLARIDNKFLGRPNELNTADPLVFFIVHVESELAHVQSLLRYLEAYQEFKAELEPVRPVVISLDGSDAPLRLRLKRLGIPLISLGDKEPRNENGYIKLLKLVTLCRHNQPQAIVFVSLVLWMASFFAVRLAKAQIWWAMKYHAYTTPDIDGYICGSPDGEPRQLGGNHWETAPFGGSDWFAPELVNAANQIRSELGTWKTIFGSIGREEKLRDPAFLDTVCSVLEANPDSLFLWTGKHQDEGIQRFFDARGLSARSKFIGWVNTRLYSQVIDVYLDSFPFPGGYTVYESMAAKKPIVMMKLDYPSVGLQNNVSPYYFSDNTDGMNGDIQALFRKNQESIFYPVATDKSSYIAYASRFATDHELSTCVGDINAQFVEKYMSNRKGMAAGYTRGIRKIIENQSAR